MSLAISILLVGIGILGSVLGLFYLKGRLESPRLGKLAYSEFVMRLTVIAAFLVGIGILLVFNEMLS